MALLASPAIALTLATKTQRQTGNWDPLTPDQYEAIRQVIRDDMAGRLTKAELVARLTQIANPIEAA